MTHIAPAAADQATSGPPLLYRNPVALSSERHSAWRVANGDYAFAADTPYVPLLIAEFGPGSRHYPILFAEGEVVTPTALLGLDASNLFVADGRWPDGVHIPAYLRRYPFGSAEIDEQGRFALMIDADSDRIIRDGTDGAPLFEGSAPSLVTKRAFAFCEAFRADAAATRDFCIALADAGLLIDRQADVTLPDGARRAIKGFKVVDMQAFLALDNQRIVDWHRRGWLAAVQFHLASLDQFAALLDRYSGAEAYTGPTSQSVGAAA